MSLFYHTNVGKGRTPTLNGKAHGNATYSLLLPGKVLYLNALLSLKKFRDRGNKEGAVQGFYVLQGAGLGRVIEKSLNREQIWYICTLESV